MLPRALLLSAVVIWGWTFVATKVLVAEIGPLEIFALRLAIGLPSWAPLCFSSASRYGSREPTLCRSSFFSSPTGIQPGSARFTAPATGS